MQLFTAGLQEPLSIDVQLQGPQSLEVAMSFARSYERREQLTLAAAQQFRPNRIAPARGVHVASPTASSAARPAGSPCARLLDTPTASARAPGKHHTWDSHGCWPHRAPLDARRGR
jgi:hypothetical protein